MFIRKHVIFFFILQNVVSSFCGTVQVDPESEGSEYVNSNEFSDYSEEDGILTESILSAFFHFLQSLFISVPELDLFRELDISFQNNMALIGWASNSNEDLENNFKEYSKRYSTLNWDSNSNENSGEEMGNNPEDNVNESSGEEMNDNPKYNVNENSKEKMDDNPGNDLNENTEEEMNKNPENNVNKNSEIPDTENNFKFICPDEYHSMISRNDIKYLIKEKAETLEIKENIVNSYYPDAAEVFKKNIGDIEEFKKRFKERPGHLLHVLHSITSWRQELEPNVEEFAAQLEQFQALEDKFNDVAKDAVVTLNQLEKYQKICKINCDEISIENRFGYEIINNSLIVSNRTSMYCIRLKDLNDYIDKKLSEEQAQYGEGLNQPLEVRDKLYEQKISDLKTDLKEAAVKQFGKTMYDILSLHDDYHHFMNDLEHVNISSVIYNIIENTAEIGFMRIGLKRDLENYRQYCMKCSNQRVKRNVFGYHKGSTLEGVEELSVIPIEKINDVETGASSGVNAVVDELVKAIIDEIKEGIQSNFTAMFAKLDTIFNDPNVVDTYVRELHPIQDDIEKGIIAEQEAFHRFRSRVPEETIHKIIVLSKESKQMVQNLESAKLFIAQFIQLF